jgi:hypothetical protein
MVRNIFSAVVRLERRTLEPPQFGQLIATDEEYQSHTRTSIPSVI